RGARAPRLRRDRLVGVLGGPQGQRPVQRRAAEQAQDGSRRGRLGQGGGSGPRGQAPERRHRSYASMTHTDWPLWEGFVRSRRGLSHTHAGTLHAPDTELPPRNARDPNTPRAERVHLWVVPPHAVTASSPDEKDPFFEPAADKPYRHPTFYEIPEGVQHL